MSLITLPLEVWTLIIRKLDTKTVCNLYDSCNYFQEVVCTPGVVRECKFSMNKLATVKSLNLDFFNDILGHLRILNLSGISDLDITALTPALDELVNLTDLDVSYTDIIIPDFVVIVKTLQTLKSLAINFFFGKNFRINKEMLLEYQQAFQGLKNVHFIGNTVDLLDKKIALGLLQKADICNLKLTSCNVGSRGYIEEDGDMDKIVMIKVCSLQVYCLEDVSNNTLGKLVFFGLINPKDYEMVLFQSCLPCSMYATPLLKEFICKHFCVDVSDLSHFNSYTGYKQVAVMFWHKEHTKFDDTFYLKLLFILKENLIYQFDYPLTETPVPTNFERYLVEQESPSPDSSYEFDFDYDFEGKRRRLSTRTYVINYDSAFQEKKEIKLRISFLSNMRIVTLRSCDFLKKLTHLTLDGDVRYTNTFFKKLFECSYCLVTLQIMKQKGIVSNPLTYLKISKVKNILLYVKATHMFPIFNCLSACTTLENIHLVNTSSSINRMDADKLPNPTELFTKCDKLYNFIFQSRDMLGSERGEALQYYKQVRSQLGIDGLNIDMFHYNNDGPEDQYNPYFSVFDVFQLKP